MCGIAGIFSLDDQPIDHIVNRSKVILKKLKHRGPDDYGSWFNKEKNSLICNTRLAIVDPNTRVCLPFSDNNKFLSFNGEIYNYKVLKKKLLEKGIKFKTQTDTEVLFHGLRMEGKNFLSRIDGMWSLAFFDSRIKKLLLSRDLLGEKHLFYCIHKNLFIFSSEMNCLLSQLDCEIEYDYSSIISSFKYRSCQPGKTLIKNVFKLLPGHIIELNNGIIKKSRNLKLDPSSWIEKIQKKKSIENLLDLYDEQLSNAVSTRVPSDTDFSSTISGGIDSTLINIYLKKNNFNPKIVLHGISNKQEDGEEEKKFSIETTKKLKLNIKIVDLHNVQTVKTYIQQCSNSFDGIFCEGSVGFRQLAYYTNNSKIKVLLLADGADEFLTGYKSDISNNYFMTNKLLKKISFLKTFFRQSNISKFLSNINMNDIINWSYCDDKKFSFRPINGGTETYDMKKIFNNYCLNSDNKFGHLDSVYLDISKKLDFSQKTSLSYANSITPDYFNLRTDRASHFHSVEFRLPFQKKSLVELMIATPSYYRIKDQNTGKFILRKLVERHLGKKVAWKKKVGFYFPAWWIDEFKIKLKMREVIGDSEIFKIPIFKKDSKDKILSMKYSRMFWFAYCLSLTNMKLKSKNFDVEYSPI